MAVPLTDLTGKRPWEWTAVCEDSFIRLRQELCRAPLLHHPDFEKPFIVDCDASDSGMGAILSQDTKDGEKLLCVESRKFSEAESKWHIREKEALAIVEALEKFRRFVLGRRFIVRSDHQSLQWLFDAKAGRLCRWALRLSEFMPVTIIHRSGINHGNVDAFTRVFADSEFMPDHAFPLGAVGTKFAGCLPEREKIIGGSTDVSRS